MSAHTKKRVEKAERAEERARVAMQQAIDAWALARVESALAYEAHERSEARSEVSK